MAYKRYGQKKTIFKKKLRWKIVENCAGLDLFLGKLQAKDHKIETDYATLKENYSDEPALM